jgi:hypothetical protein
MTSVELKVRNIKKLIKQVKSGKISLKEAGINARLEKLSKEGDSGAIWAEDLQKDYINMVKNLNK